jgi:hypothetical protein
MTIPPLGNRYRHGLRKAVGTSAGPYGYSSRSYVITYERNERYR